MRILCFVVFGTLLLSVASAEAENPARSEEVTTEKTNTPHNVRSTSEQKSEEQQLQDSDKPRNVRATKRISSFPSFSVGSPWAPLEIFEKTPSLFEHSLEDQEKLKLVLIEPFFRVKKVQNGFRSWLQQIFGKNKEKKKGPGSLIGPIKVSGLGDHVYIRTADPIENESERVVIHLKTHKNALTSSVKEIKLASPLSLGNSFGSSFGSFETLHELPIESSNFQTIYSPHFPNGEVGDLFDKSHLSASHSFWSTFPLPPASFPFETEDIFSSPSSFRKHSTEAKGSEFSGSLSKDAESPQEYDAWAPPYGSDSSYGIYENLESDSDQEGRFASKNNLQVSSGRQDIDKVQGVQSHQLEISQEEESLPLYPPLFNDSLGHSNSSDMEQLDVTNNRGNQYYESPQYSANRPGLGAYRTQSEIIISANTNNSDEKLEEKYINSDGIREVEAPNLYQGGNSGRYQYREENYDKKENREQAKSDSSNVENSKKTTIFQSSVYGNYGVKDSDSEKMSNETREVVNQLHARYPWTYRVSKGRTVIPKTSENEEKETSESSVLHSQVQSQSEIRKASLQRNRSRLTVEGGSNKEIGNDLRPRKRSKENLEIKKLENGTSENIKMENENLATGKSDLQTDTSVAISEIGIHGSKNYTSVLEKKEKYIIGDNNCTEEDNSKCNNKKKEKSSEKDMKETMTAEDLKKVFVEESKRFEDVLKTVEEESKAIKGESKSVEKLKSTTEESKSEEGLKFVKGEIKSGKGESKSLKEETKSFKEEKPSQIKRTTTEPTLKNDNQKSNEKVYVVTPSSRFINRTRFDTRMKKSPKKNRGEIRNSNSSVRAEIRKPVIQAPRDSIIDVRFNKKLKNNTKMNSNLEMEIPKITPPTHISRIYAKNRFNDRLQSNLKATKSKEEAGKEDKAGKEEKKSEETTKSPDTMSKEEKEKEQLHMRMAKLFPKVRNYKQKNETEIIVTIKEESTIRNNTEESY